MPKLQTIYDHPISLTGLGTFQATCVAMHLFRDNLAFQIWKLEDEIEL